MTEKRHTIPQYTRDKFRNAAKTPITSAHTDADEFTNPTTRTNHETSTNPPAGRLRYGA